MIVAVYVHNGPGTSPWRNHPPRPSSPPDDTVTILAGTHAWIRSYRSTWMSEWCHYGELDPVPG